MLSNDDKSINHEAFRVNVPNHEIQQNRKVHICKTLETFPSFCSILCNHFGGRYLEETSPTTKYKSQNSNPSLLLSPQDDCLEGISYVLWAEERKGNRDTGTAPWKEWGLLN